LVVESKSPVLSRLDRGPSAVDIPRESDIRSDT
jgi:hypothetical protein